MPVQGAGTPGHVPVRLCPLALPTVGRVGDPGAIRGWRSHCGDHGLSPFMTATAWEALGPQRWIHRDADPGNADDAPCVRRSSDPFVEPDRPQPDVGARTPELPLQFLPHPLVHTDRGGSRWPHIAFDAHRVVDPYSMTSSRAKYMCDVVERQSTLSRLPRVGRCCIKAAPKPAEPGTRRAIPTGPRCSSLPKVGSRDGRELTGRGPRCHARLRAILVAHLSSDWRQQRAPHPFSKFSLAGRDDWLSDDRHRRPCR
jgi:hypothetical protein